MDQRPLGPRGRGTLVLSGAVTSPEAGILLVQTGCSEPLPPSSHTPTHAYTHLQARRSLGSRRASKTLEKNIKGRKQGSELRLDLRTNKQVIHPMWGLMPVPCPPGGASPSLTGAPGAPGSPWPPCGR